MADESVVLNLNNCICLKKDRKSNPPQKPTRISNPPYSILLIHPGNNKTTTTFLAISNALKNTNLKNTKTFVWVMGRTSCTASSCVLVCVLCAPVISHCRNYLHKPQGLAKASGPIKFWEHRGGAHIIRAAQTSTCRTYISLFSARVCATQERIWGPCNEEGYYNHTCACLTPNMNVRSDG